MLTAVAFQFSDRGDNLAVAAVVVAVLASLMVSYTRARAEALGVECKVGIADRAVRVVILSAGLDPRQGRRHLRRGTPGARGVCAGGTLGHHRRAAHLACARRADPGPDTRFRLRGDFVSKNGSQRARPGGRGTGGTRSGKVRVAIIGVGNCASSFVQGVHYYRDADPAEPVPGLMHVDLGGYHVRDIEFSAAFDIDAEKVGKDLSEAIFAGPEQHAEARRRQAAQARRPGPARDDPRRPRQVPQGEDHQGRGLDRRHRRRSSRTPRPTSSSPTSRSAPSRRPSGTSSRSSRPAARS